MVAMTRMTTKFINIVYQWALCGYVMDLLGMQYNISLKNNAYCHDTCYIIHK